jgi:hypothetical protein
MKVADSLSSGRLPLKGTGRGSKIRNDAGRLDPPC